MFWRARQIAYRVLTLGLPTGWHLSRYSMYERLGHYRQAWSADARALSVSGSQELCRVLGFSDSQIVNVEYPAVTMARLPFRDGEFDAVVSDQVLEHVDTCPQQAIREAFRTLKVGGLAVHTTCLLTQVHPAPRDLWRFTPDGLSQLCREGSQVVEASGWGNRWAVAAICLGMRFDPIPHATWHPLHRLATRNDREWPIVTWVVARRLAAHVD